MAVTDSILLQKILTDEEASKNFCLDINRQCLFKKLHGHWATSSTMVKLLLQSETHPYQKLQNMLRKDSKDITKALDELMILMYDQGEAIDFFSNLGISQKGVQGSFARLGKTVAYTSIAASILAITEPKLRDAGLIPKELIRAVPRGVRGKRVMLKWLLESKKQPSVELDPSDKPNFKKLAKHFKETTPKIVQHQPQKTEKVSLQKEDFDLSEAYTDAYMPTGAMAGSSIAVFRPATMEAKVSFFENMLWPRVDLASQAISQAFQLWGCKDIMTDCAKAEANFVNGDLAWKNAGGTGIKSYVNATYYSLRPLLEARGKVTLIHKDQNSVADYLAQYATHNKYSGWLEIKVKKPFSIRMPPDTKDLAKYIDLIPKNQQPEERSDFSSVIQSIEDDIELHHLEIEEIQQRIESKKQDLEILLSRESVLKKYKL